MFLIRMCHYKLEIIITCLNTLLHLLPNLPVLYLLYVHLFLANYNFNTSLLIIGNISTTLYACVAMITIIVDQP